MSDTETKTQVITVTPREGEPYLLIRTLTKVPLKERGA
jgi:hypothetical protein